MKTIIVILTLLFALCQFSFAGEVTPPSKPDVGQTFLNLSVLEMNQALMDFKETIHTEAHPKHEDLVIALETLSGTLTLILKKLETNIQTATPRDGLNQQTAQLLNRLSESSAHIWNLIKTRKRALTVQNTEKDIQSIEEALLSLQALCKN